EAPLGLPGRTASRPYQPEFALSWWKRGESDGEHAGAPVRNANTYPERVTPITSLCAFEEVSVVPRLPIAGVATVQSVDTFGQAAEAGWPDPFSATKSSEAVPPTTSWPAWPSMSPTAGPVRNCRSETGLGKPSR